MKKTLLTGAALVAMASSPAMAQGLSLDLAGHFKGYGVYNDNDEAAGDSLDDMGIRKETEVHFTGETTLDSGLTVGVHVEMDVDANDGDVDESYMYLSGGWGRVNFGEEDGAAYLLQVSAPSADSNVDGLRQYISSYNATGVAAGDTYRVDYDHAPRVFNAAGEIVDLSKRNKLTYMTPVFNGFQMGVSYVPTLTDDNNGVATFAADNNAGYDDGYEVAARYEGMFEGVGMAFGAGWSTYNNENDTNTGAPFEATGDLDIWNVGLDLDFGGFGLGVAYLNEEAEVETIDIDIDTWVVGADYQMGAYKLGASWLNEEGELEGTAVESELDRYTAGVSYAYGPGMSFRGSVSMIDGDDNYQDSTQVLLGTQVNF